MAEEEAEKAAAQAKAREEALALADAEMKQYEEDYAKNKAEEL